MPSFGVWQPQGVGCPLDTQCIDRQAQQGGKIFPPATSSMVSMVMRLKVGSSSISRQALRRTSVESNRSYERGEERTLQDSPQTCTQMNQGMDVVLMDCYILFRQRREPRDLTLAHLNSQEETQSHEND